MLIVFGVLFVRRRRFGSVFSRDYVCFVCVL